MSSCYGYIRVSSRDQNEDRQLIAMQELSIPPTHVYIDKQSGKDFNRPKYKRLLRKLRRDDLLYIKSIDRLGRNYHEIQEEWRKITKKKGADIVVLDMPLLDTRVKESNLIGKFISDIVLQILSFVAQSERENIKQRQAEGIRIAKEKGVIFGRPKYKLPSNFAEVVDRYHNKELSHYEAIDILHLKRSTFFKYAKIYKNK